MMSIDTKLKRASVLRWNATEDKRESLVPVRKHPPVGSAHRLKRCAPIVFSQILQSKGFGGGVPLNTETAALKPRVGIE